MRTRERHLWEWLELGGRELQRHGAQVVLERVENCAGTGMPDVYGVMVFEFWIELKSVPRKPLIDCELDTDQVLWHQRYRRCGGKGSFILVQVGTGHTARRYLIPSSHVAHLAKSISEPALSALACHKGTPTASDVILLAAHS